jgi:exoribonuclease II
MTNDTAPQQQAAQDLTELEFTPIPADEATEMDDRIYLLGVRIEAVRG